MDREEKIGSPGRKKVMRREDEEANMWYVIDSEDAFSTAHTNRYKYIHNCTFIRICTK